ncbi:MAG: hypothetical protein JWR32_1881 [Mycobacterium sp.]|jgi:hypothetical protein|nr:hypothetical protein [Mycobacterium sp.]
MSGVRANPATHSEFIPVATGVRLLPEAATTALRGGL